MRILVFVDATSPRLQFIVSHILSEMLGFEVIITQNVNDFDDFLGPKIAYAKGSFNNAIRVTPHTLLSRSSISEQSIEISEWRSAPIFFQTSRDADIPFDIFAAAFYLISRYEEYLIFEPDEHGRFKSTNSLAYKSGFLDMPIVDIWVKELAGIIRQSYPEVKVYEKGFSYIPTIDIDNAYAYQYKGFIRTFLGTSNALLRLRFADFFRRVAVLCKFQHDPFDTYNGLFQLFTSNSEALWFILGGQYGKYDKNIALDAKPMKRLIRQIAERFQVGIHPSFGSGISQEQVNVELKLLSQNMGKKITASRQHYLRVTLPETYRILSELGITHDYSMGYSDVVGFRAGTCTPFRFYDLMDEKVLPLTIVPFQVMDRALLQGLQCNPDEAVAKTLGMANSVKQVGGTFVTVWHNESLSGINEWVGWKEVLAEIVNRINELKP
jgi:hypothetical protein